VAGALRTAQVWYAWNRRLGLFGFAWFAIILIGSVLLGWHYAVDGIAGILMAVGAWAVAPRIVDRKVATLARKPKEAVV
jgi:membrane-associated phospholipid phosphatase